ncbi:MAG: hypothetical protein ACFFG0_01255 [Candidatus Thorarchaeota archaeon]
MQNLWLNANMAGLERVIKILTEMEYLPIFQDYPVRSIQLLINSSVQEIKKLQIEVEKLQKENAELKKQLEPVPDENPEESKTQPKTTSSG